MTNRLYYDQTYLTAFDAVVTAVRPREGGCDVSLNQSAFYPTSGGQPFDTGTLGGLRVTDVFVDSDGEVWHSIDGTLTESETVHGEIDWARRFEHMQQHAGEHMIAGAVWRQLRGSTIGLHLGADFSTIDVTMPNGETHLTDAQIRALEDDVNDQIQRDVPIRCWFPDEEELKSLPLRKPPTVSEHIRIVAIGDCEMVACGGTHPSTAGQIALVKIIDARPSKGKLRLSFLCGQRAVRDYQARLAIADQAAALLSTQPAQVPEGIERLKKAVAELEHELTRLRREEAVRRMDELLNTADMLDGCKLVKASFGALPMDALRTLASDLIARENVVALLSSEKENGVNLIFARSAAHKADMGRLLREAASQFGGKGGGKPDFAQGSAASSDALDWAEKKLREG